MAEIKAYDGEEYVVDRHTMYANTQYMIQPQIESMLHQFVKKNSLYDKENPIRFKVNVVKNKDQLCKFSYIWVSSSNVYKLLTNEGEIEQIYDNNLVLSHGGATKDEVVKAVGRVILNSEEILLINGFSLDNMNFKVFMDSESKAYISLQSKEIHNLIVGKNINGTARVQVEFEEDPDSDDWGAGETTYITLEPLVKLGPIKRSGTTIEITDIRSVEDIPEEIRIGKSNLLDFPKFEYTQEQISTFKLDDPYHTISFQPARLTLPPEEEYNYHVLVASGIPTYITADVLKREFSDYVSDKEVMGTLRGKRGERSRSAIYPHIYISNTERTIKATIIFNPDSYDSLFANKMTRQLKVCNSITGYTDILYFNYQRKRKFE